MVETNERNAALKKESLVVFLKARKNNRNKTAYSKKWIVFLARKSCHATGDARSEWKLEAKKIKAIRAIGGNQKKKSFLDIRFIYYNISFLLGLLPT